MGKIFVKLLLLSIVGGAVYFFIYMFPIMRSSSQRSSLDDANKIYLYEGLPNQDMEVSAFEKESKRKDIREKAGFHFYNPKLELDEARAEVLKDILASGSSYKLQSAKKNHGTFHADFGVFWRVEQKKFSMLICFSCSEIKIIDGDDIHHYDMVPKIEEKLKNLLIPLAKKRPKNSLVK